MLSYACSIPPVKQPVNAASGSLPICLCQYGKTDRPNIPVNACRGRTFSQFGISDAGRLPMMQNWGSNIRRKAGKSRELRGVQRPLAKSPKLV